METMENLLEYTSVQWVVVTAVLTFGVAAMAAGLVYFLSTRDRIASHYRLSSTLSAVVMVSAFLELGLLLVNWRTAFEFNGAMWVSGSSTFTNAFRYMNWSIDVPVLLTQILVVFGFTGKQFTDPWVKFVVAGLLMIWTGFIGQFYESAGIVYEGISIAPFWIWGIISTLFFFYILYLVPKVISRGNRNLSEDAAGMMNSVRNLLIVSWWLYVVAYLMPVISFTAWGVVARTIIYTVADVISKVIYGVMLGRVARLRSEAEGYIQDPLQGQLHTVER
jgi:bacteriorhodopsin